MTPEIIVIDKNNLLSNAQHYAQESSLGDSWDPRSVHWQQRSFPPVLQDTPATGGPVPCLSPCITYIVGRRITKCIWRHPCPVRNWILIPSSVLVLRSKDLARSWSALLNQVLVWRHVSDFSHLWDQVALVQVITFWEIVYIAWCTVICSAPTMFHTVRVDDFCCS
jgi:hypothetical protein